MFMPGHPPHGKSDSFIIILTVKVEAGLPRKNYPMPLCAHPSRQIHHMGLDSAPFDKIRAKLNNTQQMAFSQSISVAM